MMDYERLMKKARKTNAKRDAIDRKHGFKPPSECDPDLQLRTAMEAIKAGIMTDDWDCIGEAQSMLEDLHKVVTGRRWDEKPRKA